MSAAEIITLGNPATVNTNSTQTNTANLTLKELNDKLITYKLEKGLSELQMLEDSFRFTNIAPDGSLTEMTLDEMQITPIGSVNIMSVSNTYSLLAGRKAFQDYDAYRHMNNINGSVQMNTTFMYDESWWYVNYYGGALYTIISEENPDLSLVYEDGSSPNLSGTIEGTPTSEHLWTINLIAGNKVNVKFGSNYLTTDLELSSGAGDLNWMLHSNNYVSSITINADAVYVEPNSTVSLPQISTQPSNAYGTSDEGDITWHYTDNLLYTDEDGLCAGSSAGLCQLYCRNTVTGVESNRINVIVYNDFDAVEHGLYLLRPYTDTITYTSNMLTMTYSDGDTDLILNSYGTMIENNVTRASHEDWKTMSRAFSITQVGNENKYRISAIICTEQYRASNGKYACTYNYRTEKPNTLYVSPSGGLDLKMSHNNSANTHIPDDSDQSQLWRIYDIEEQVFFVNVLYPQYVLSYTNTGPGTTMISDIANAGWSVSFFGLDVPLINQTYYSTCVPTSTLQALHVINPFTAMSLNGNSSSTLENQIKYMAYNIFGYTDLDYQAILSSPSGAAQKLNQFGANYITTADKSKNHEEYVPKIGNSLSNGYPVLAGIKTFVQNGLPYLPYGADEVGSHVICIMGCDEDTGLIAISECYVNNLYIGIHLVTPLQLSYALNNGLIYYE